MSQGFLLPRTSKEGGDFGFQGFCIDHRLPAETRRVRHDPYSEPLGAGSGSEPVEGGSGPVEIGGGGGGTAFFIAAAALTR